MAVLLEPAQMGFLEVDRPARLEAVSAAARMTRVAARVISALTLVLIRAG
ncbi:hypothetical protein [Methylobacterium oxalidis]